jgi:hypothetical protein
VERRARLARGGALETAGKRAAFALFYAPLHFLVTREIVRTLPGASAPFTHLLDLGCGSGAAGAAWVTTAARSGQNMRLTGIDRHPWAVAEAKWTYQQMGLNGRAIRGDVGRAAIEGGVSRRILAAYTVNELSEESRRALLPQLLSAHAAGAPVLIIEPIARRMSGWWDDWERAFLDARGRADEWRFNVPLPQRQHDLARAAGLNPRELTARTLWLGPAPPGSKDPGLQTRTM